MSFATRLAAAPFAIGLVLAASVMAAYAQAPAASDGPIVVYNAQHKSLTEEWSAAFTKETGIKVVIRNGGDTELGNQIVQEGISSSADVFLTENSPAMALVERAGLFAQLPDDVLKLIPAEYRPSSGRWTGIAARSTVFVYNKSKLTEAQLPKSIMDLAEPAWKGRWAASPAGADFQAIVSAILELKGEKETLAWLKGMKANAAAYKGNGVAMKAVNAGQSDAAVIYHYYYFGDQAKTGENSDKLGVHYFRKKDPGAFLSISGAGVLASSKHQAASIAFVKWLAGKGGQDILKNGTSYEYAIGVNTDSHAKLEPLKALQSPAIDPAKLNSKKVTELMTEAGLL